MCEWLGEVRNGHLSNSFNRKSFIPLNRRALAPILGQFWIPADMVGYIRYVTGWALSKEEARRGGQLVLRQVMPVWLQGVSQYVL